MNTGKSIDLNEDRPQRMMPRLILVPWLLILSRILFIDAFFQEGVEESDHESSSMR